MIETTADHTIRPLSPSVGALLGAVSSLHHFNHLLFSYGVKSRAVLALSGDPCALLGATAALLTLDGALFTRHVHQDDQFEMIAAIEAALDGSRELDQLYRWIRPDTGETIWLRALGTRHSPLSHEPVLQGVLYEVSPIASRMRATTLGLDAIKSVLPAANAPMAVLDADRRIIFAHRPPAHPVPLELRPLFEHGATSRLTIETILGSPPALFLEGLRHVLSGESARHVWKSQEGEHSFTVEIAPVLLKGTVEGALIAVSETTKVVLLERRVEDLERRDRGQIMASAALEGISSLLQRIGTEAAALALAPDAAKAREIQVLSERARQLLQSTGFADSARTVDLNVTVLTALQRIDRSLAGVRLSLSFGSSHQITESAANIRVLAHLLRRTAQWAGAGGTLHVRTDDEVTASVVSITAERADSSALSATPPALRMIPGHPFVIRLEHCSQRRLTISLHAPITNQQLATELSR